MSNVMACEFDVSGCLLHNLGNDYRGYFVETPWPGIKSCVIDSRTGAILGNTLTQVKRDIKEYNLHDDGVRKSSLQIKARALEVPPEQFWVWIVQMLIKRSR